MAYNGFAIDQYLDAAAVTAQLDELIRQPVWSIRRDRLADYVENYFNARCPRSREMIGQARKVIPGGVQHNLAFNYPFPIVITRAEGARLWDIDGNWYYDLLQAGGPTILGSNVPEVRGQVVELLKSSLKIVILGVVLYNLLKDQIIVIARMMDTSVIASSVYVLKEIFNMVLKIGMVFIAIAGFDLFYQRWSFEKDMKMTKEEVKEEFKQMEGDPKVKGKIRSIQQSMARSRMMQAVPDADVIIRNPTHYAVALKYDLDRDNAPIVIAKGQDHIALKIVEIGELNKVTVIENKPLARGIYASTPLGGQIPAEYYGVVAEILVEVFRMNKKLE